MDSCPTCRRPTIRRLAGEWCRWCAGWIVEHRYHYGDGAGSTVRSVSRPK